MMVADIMSVDSHICFRGWCIETASPSVLDRLRLFLLVGQASFVPWTEALWCRLGLLSVRGSGTLLGPMWSRISSHFRLADVVSSSWKCSINWSSAIARGIDAPESTIIVLDPGMVSRLGGLSDVVCVRFSGWAPFDFRVARAAFVQTLWNIDT